HRAVEHRRTRSVGLVARALRQLDRQDVAPLTRRADLLQLDQLRIVAGDLPHVRGEAVRAVVVPPDLVAAGCLSRGELLDGLAAIDADQLRVDAAGGERV